MGIIYTALNYYRSNTSNPQKEKTPFDVKLLMLKILKELTLYRNKKNYSKSTQIQNILSYLRQNNLNLASTKMETVILEENLIEVCNHLIVSASILHEKYMLISSNTECPKEIEKHLQNLIYASQYLQIEDAGNFRELMQYKFGSVFVESALTNRNFCIDYRIVNAFKTNKNNDSVIAVKLKYLANQYNIKCDFPVDILVDPMNFDYIELDNANPYCSKNSKLFEEFEKSKLNKKDFIIEKQTNLDNGFVLVNSQFDMDKLNNYCKTNDIHIKETGNINESMQKKNEMVMSGQILNGYMSVNYNQFNGGNNNNINKSMHGFENISNNKVPDWSLKSTNNKNISGKDFSFEKLNEVDKEKIKIWNKSEQINVNKVLKQINNVDTNKEEESKKENDSENNDNDNVINEENEPEETKLNENEHVEEQHLENKEQSQEENENEKEKEIRTENSDKNEESKDKEQQEVQINNDEK